MTIERPRTARSEDRKRNSIAPLTPEQVTKLEFAMPIDISNFILAKTGVRVAPGTIANWPVRRKTPHRRCLLLSVPDVLAIVEMQLRNAPVVKAGRS